MRTCLLYSLNGPTWVFPMFTVYLHMGFTDYYVLSLVHGLHLRNTVQYQGLSNNLLYPPGSGPGIDLLYLGMLGS